MRRFHLVFTPVGVVVLFAALLGLIRALTNRNSYEIILFSALLLLLLVLGITGIWKSRKLKTFEPGWKHPSPMTANAGEETQHQTLLTGLNAFIPLFFRLHFVICGRFFPSGSGSGYPVLVETSVPRGDTEAKMLLDFPMSGIFHGEGFCRLHDMFGFFAFPCGRSQKSTVKIRCSPCFGKKISINTQSGAEDRRNKPSADEERFYMREYTPGDRLRDINWKSSEKIDTLITRISTDNQEKINRIEVHFRNYRDQNRGQQASLEELWLLDRAKARLSYFLRSLMEQNSSLIFDVRTASGNWEIGSIDELEVFFDELAGISFMPLQQEITNPAGTADVYVFSTACDVTSGDVALHAGLPAFLVTCNQRPVTLFLVQPAKQKADNKEQKEDIDVLRISDFTVRGCTPSLRGLVPGKLKPLSAQTGKTEMFYAELKL